VSYPADVAGTRKMHEHYAQGMTLRQVGALFGLNAESVRGRFHRQGLAVRTKVAPPSVEFDGDRYAPTKYGYFRKTYGDRRHLHVAKWEKANGRVPRGHVVAFVDGDRMNIELDNLECLPLEEAGSLRKLPLELKRCLACGEAMPRRLGVNYHESRSAYAKRKTCDAKCSGEWKRGRRRGSRMP
jgi:hypothetical protein